MDTDFVFNSFDNGLFVNDQHSLNLADLNWNPHPVMRGVSLKDIITSSDTDGAISCHIVRIEPNCKIVSHSHQNSLEIHEVIGGEGFCILGSKNYKYKKGVISNIPQKIEHEVEAGSEGLYLFAKFIPAIK